MFEWNATTITMAVVAFIVYMLPAAIAANRNLKRESAVYALNFFLGWTGAIWLILLLYASFSDNRKPAEPKKEIS